MLWYKSSLRPKLVFQNVCFKALICMCLKKLSLFFITKVIQKKTGTQLIF